MDERKLRFDVEVRAGERTIGVGTRAPHRGQRLSARALALAGLLAAAPAADLDRHRPVLRYDSHERVFASAVDGKHHHAALGVPPRVYGHVARERGQTWLQYWIFYASNPQDRGIVRTGRHEGDWSWCRCV